MAEGIIISINVTPILREFFMSINEGSDVIICKRSDFLSHKIKYLLKRPPIKYKPCSSLGAKLRIQLCEFNILDKRIFTDFKNYLDHQSNRIIFNELNTVFKNVFHNHVSGYVRAKDFHPGCQKDAMNDFCFVYKLPCNKITLEMLKKSWDRSTEKKRLKDKNNILHCPL